MHTHIIDLQSPPPRLKLVRSGELQTSIEHDAGFLHAPFVGRDRRAYLVVPKAFGSWGFLSTLRILSAS